MLLYYTTQVISTRMVHTNYKAENSATAQHLQTLESQNDIIKPKKLSNPVLESLSHKGLHRELLVSHRWGLLPGQKGELQRVMEQRRLELGRQAHRPRTDLEQELLRRQLRLREYELEEQKRLKELENVPEFVRVRDNLRHIRVLGH